MDDQPHDEHPDDLGGEGAGESQQSSRFIQKVPWKTIVAVLALLILWFGIGQLCPPMYWRF